MGMLLFTVHIPFSSCLFLLPFTPPHSAFAVLDPAHLDSADDFTYDVSDNGSENDFSNVGQSGRSYDAVFGPDVNIEYAGFVLALKSSAPSFCLLSSIFKFI